MAQGDYVISDQPGATFLPDINGILQAIVTQNAGGAEPSPSYPHQIWVDTGTSTVKQRNAANTAWVDLHEFGSGGITKRSFAERAADPATGPDQGALYFKQAGGQTELFARGENNATPVQITSGGTLLAPDPFPSGGIIMWSGSIGSIPGGWLLCDGSNGTPNLRDRFVVGAGGSYGVDGAGGASAHTHSVSGSVSVTVHGHTLSAAQMPPHSHGLLFVGDSNPSQGVGFKGATGSGSFPGYNTNYIQAAGGGGSHSHGAAGSLSGGSAASKSHLPPYYALAYIMKS